MEDDLGQLLELTNEANRSRWALRWKAEGKKVVGILCSYVPEEIVHAVGMMPWRVMGTGQASTPRANVYRRSNSCLFCNHVLESLLLGQYDFLDAVIATNWDQDLVRLWDVWQCMGKTPATFILHVPRNDSQLCLKQFSKEISALCSFLEGVAGQRITEDSLLRSISVHNKTRHLLRTVYELRKRATPPLSGAEALRIAIAAQIMPKEVFNEKLVALLPHLEQRTASIKTVRPRVLVSSDRLDDPAYLELVEGSGCLVAMDDLDTGSRYFWRPVENNGSAYQNPVDALAARCLMQPASPRMLTWEKQVNQVAEWAQEFNVRGLIELPLAYSRPREMRSPFFLENLQRLGIPAVSFRREYQIANVGQLRTRIGAFLEMLEPPGG